MWNTRLNHWFHIILFLIFYISVYVSGFVTDDNVMNMKKVGNNDNVKTGALNNNSVEKIEDSARSKPEYDEYIVEYENNDSDKLNENQQNKTDDNEFSNYYIAKIPFQTGDFFTPNDLLPVAIKFAGILGEPGSGKGIVSSSRSAEDMADRIFSAFFSTMKRIVVLRDEDIPGLDAFQALAIKEKPVNYEDLLRTYTEKPKSDLNNTINKGPRKCRYMLLTKKELRPRSQFRSNTIMDENIQNEQRLQKTLPKTRNEVSNSKENGQIQGSHGTNKFKNGMKILRLITNLTKSPIQMNTSLRMAATTKSPDNKTRCTWSYVDCGNKGLTDLNTCKLQIKCNNNKTYSSHEIDDLLHEQEKKREEEATSLKSRRMFGVTELDVEIEKIITKHTATLRDRKTDDNKIESLDEYFNNLLIAQQSNSGRQNNENAANTIKRLSVKSNKPVEDKANN